MTDFKTALIQDPKLSQITDQQVFGVRVGASNNTYQSFSAVSDSASSLIFNCQLPSESVVLSRDVSLRATVTISFDSPNDVQYGRDICLAPFPLAMGMQSISSQINNSTVSLNLADILPQLLIMNDSAMINKWQGTCPTLRDQVYRLYMDAIDLSDPNNPIPANNDPFGDINIAGYEQFPEPRGAHPATLVKGTQDPATGYYPYTLTWETTEPIFLSPYIFGHPDYNLGGFVGINTVNLNCNMTSTPSRTLRSRNTDLILNLRWGTSSQPNPFAANKPTLLLNFLSSQSTQLIPARQVLPYADFPRYITSQSSWDGGKINVNNIQLNQLPDKFIICVRPKMSSMGPESTDYFWPIRGISVNLNNQSGLLSSCTRENLWRMSVEAGSTQSYSEFRGSALNGYKSDGTQNEISTIGSLLVLDPAMHLSLPAMLTSGSIGQYSFNIEIDCDSLDDTNTLLDVEAVVICMNSGIMVNAAGSSAIYTGILTKEMVVATATESDVPPMDVPEYERMVGGRSGNFGALKRMLASKLGRKGGAMSGGSHSGGAHSGGVRRFV